MQRIPNPVSDLDVFVRVFRDLHDLLKSSPEFNLDNISTAMVARNNVTSQGAIGDEALRRSTRQDRSRDPIYNQSKMYAELFRTLGWIQSTSSALNYTFTLLGHHVATAHNPAPLLRECLLGIAYPNEVLGVQSEQTIRVFGAIILTMDVLGSISRDEMMAGPMSISDDTNQEEFHRMIALLEECRESPDKLDKVLEDIASRRGIKRKPTMENYTRFPMAAIPWAGWGIKKGRAIIYITEHGKDIAKQLQSSRDVRLADFYNLPESVKPALIRWSFYSMLERAGFNVDPVRETIDGDSEILRNHDESLVENVYFSPFQQLSRETIQKYTPELISEIESDSEVSGVFTNPFDAENFGVSSRMQLDTLIFEFSDVNKKTPEQAQRLVSDIKNSLDKEEDVESVINEFYLKFRNSNKDIFYPLVADLFSIIGFDCRTSRAGQNYERADAIIVDDKRSIPIEIKSPGEETEISVKGVRQALENKIILLSRRNYPTDQETTSLVVGYNPPNERSEVHQLVQDIYNTFNIRIGIIDFRSLLTLSIYSIACDKQVVLNDFHLIKGLVSVENITSTC